MIRKFFCLFGFHSIVPVNWVIDCDDNDYGYTVMTCEHCGKEEVL